MVAPVLDNASCPFFSLKWEENYGAEYGPESIHTSSHLAYGSIHSIKSIILHNNYFPISIICDPRGCLA